MSRHYDEDAYAPVGTPFDPLETEEDVHKAKVRKDKEHYVLDEQGRRRFHGAFTGGFSAGYFNTVGSKEGWAPSTFRSSRESKADSSTQKPEDFMDAEDLGAHGIAPRQVSTRPNFQQRGSEGAGAKRQYEFQPSVIPGGAPLQNLIIPARASVGARLLRAMGWREGQGVGPRVQRPGVEKMYGCSLPGSVTGVDKLTSSGSEYLPDEVRGFTFAPRDVRLCQFEGKEDLHGIGYRGMEERAVLSGKETKRAVHGMRGEAFGVGALEEEDAEDSVYGEESMTSYDVTLMKDGDVEMERNFGWTGGVEGSWGMDSFKKATKPRNKTKVYHAPEVPRDFVPIHRFSILNIKSVGGSGSSQHHKVTASERSQLLADKPGSVFSLMSAADRVRLRKVVSSNDKPATQTLSPTHRPHPQATPTLPSSNTQLSVAHSSTPNPLSQPQTMSTLGDTTIGGIKPFANNLLKQARYEAFLSGRSPNSDGELVRMTEWERQRERDEFARMRRVYQPLAVSLSTRFTREGDTKEKEEPPEPDSVQAAKANMFGVLTREVVEWHPHPVLCKRFNIPDPYPNDGLVGTVTEKHKQSSSATKHIQFLPVQTPSSSSEAGVTPGNREQTAAVPETFTPCLTTMRDSTASAPHGVRLEDNTATNNKIAPVYEKKNESAENIPGTLETGSSEQDEAKEEARPPMDLFKAIFAESSSSESEGEEAKQDEENPVSRPQEAAPVINVNQEEGSRDDERLRKSRWRDLSAVASRPLTTATDLHKSSAGEKAGILSRDAAAVTDNRESTVHNGEEMNNTTEEKQVFGPTLPPGFDVEVVGSERERSRNVGRHKHKHHHKTSSSLSRKEKRRKHGESSDEEGHGHRRRKEKKKSEHKH